ncbi:MAG: hypothetical protein RSB14_05260 [Kiritimatiellia bacterium]
MKKLDPKTLNLKALAPRAVSDVIGIGISSGQTEQFPVIRLRKNGTEVTVAAIGKLDLPGMLPESWESAAKPQMWSLKSHYQAPHAAFAVDSAQAVIRLSTQVEDAPMEGNEPVSEGGLRKVIRQVAPPNVCLETGLPEYQVLWLSRILPEGHQPTASSVQVASSALLNLLTYNPDFIAAGGTGFAAIVRAECTILVAYHEHRPVLYREHPAGLQQLREALVTQLGIDEKLIDSMLKEHLIDPMPVLLPVLAPIFRQIGIARDYLTRRTGNDVNLFFLFGVSSGVEYWRQAYENSAIGIPLKTPSIFEGLSAAIVSKQEPFDETDYLTAYGAAVAVLEDHA